MCKDCPCDGSPDRTTVALSTVSVIWVAFSSMAPPLLLSMAVTLAARTPFRYALVTLELIARPASDCKGVFLGFAVGRTQLLLRHHERHHERHAYKPDMQVHRKYA